MTRQEIFEVVKSNIVEIIEEAEGVELEEHHSMRDFDADSLEIVEVVARSMKQLRIKVPRDQLGSAQNLADLVDLFEAQIDGK